jgi:hypothetical protein
LRFDFSNRSFNTTFPVSRRGFAEIRASKKFFTSFRILALFPWRKICRAKTLVFYWKKGGGRKGNAETEARIAARKNSENLFFQFQKKYKK